VPSSSAPSFVETRSYFGPDRRKAEDEQSQADVDAMFD